MSVKDLKISIERLIQDVNDPIVLGAYLEILKKLMKVHKYKIMGYESDGSPITLNTLDNKVGEAITRIELAPRKVPS